MNIWEIAKNKLAENKEKTAKLEQKLDDENGSTNENYLAEVRKRHESHIIFCGNRKSGKSSFIQDFVEKREELKESVGLEFSYARRTRGNVKDVANIWELGGGHSVATLLTVPINSRNVEICSLIVLLDLTKLDELWITVETIVETGRKIVENIAKHSADVERRLGEKLKIRLEKFDENDRKMCMPCPIPLTVVATKYDEFQNYESEKRRNICQFLRFIAHYYGANLMMYSSKMEQFAKLAKNMASHFGFGTVCPQGTITDHNKPMFIQCGSDSLEEIGAPPVTDSFMRAASPFELWKDSYSTLFPQQNSTYNNDEANKQDPLTDPLFKEPSIDSLVTMKRKELENHIRQKRDREAAEARAAERISKINVRQI